MSLLQESQRLQSLPFQPAQKTREQGSYRLPLPLCGSRGERRHTPQRSAFLRASSGYVDRLHEKREETDAGSDECSVKADLHD